MDKKEREERRAVNQIWNAAGDYTIRPEYVAMDRDGRADFYFNNIIGSAYRYYEFDRLNQLFHSFSQKEDGALYEDLLWIGLENCIFERAREERPAYAALRETYARQFLEDIPWNAAQELILRIKAGHCQRILGEEPQLTAFERKLLDAIEFSPTLSTEEIVQQMSRVMSSFFGKTIWELDEMGSTWFSRRKFLTLPGFRGRTGTVRRIQWGEDEGAAGKGKPSAGEKLKRLLGGRPKESAVRAYVESCFGLSVLSEKERSDMEKKLCTGNHRDCYLHLTRGELPRKEAVKSDIRWQREAAVRQREKNLAYFRKNRIQNKITIARLTERIQNALLVYREPYEGKSREGRLQAGRVWRSLYLGDRRIFSRTEQNGAQELSVDLLLDGSASQREQQEKLANQAYLIAESLTRCGLPVRVSSFCSVSGCTVLQILRDYQETGKNEAVFRYRAMGWNRDGLGIRAIGHLMEQEAYEHQMLIVLSDASPNDDQKMPRDSGLPGGGFFPGQEYSEEAGVKDTAAEVLYLRRQGIRVLCIFTGGDRELPAARQIYGKDLVRIPSISWLADTVGRLIQDKIREM